MFFQEIVKYLKANPIQLAIIGGCAVVLLAIIIALIAVGVNAKKRKKAAALSAETAVSETSQPAEVTPTKPVDAATPATVEESPKATAPAAETPAATAPAATAPAANEPAKETAKATKPIAPSAKETAAEKKAADTKPATPKKATTTNAAKSALAATKKMSETPTAKEPQPTAAFKQTAKAEKPVATSAKEKATEKKTEKTKPATPKYTGKWVICKLVLTDGNDKPVESNYFFELRASNGELLLASEEYSSHAGALKGIQTHKDNVEKGNFRITLSKKGDYIFKLLTAKNTLLCTGANYKSLERCESAIASTKRFAATAVLQEEMEELHIKLPEDDEPVQPDIPDNGYTGKWIISTTGNEEVGILYYFELFASNGEKLLTSEEYTTYEGAVNAVATHKANIAKGNFRISITKRGDYLFKLLGGNGQLLCLGEHYKTRSRCESAVESVKRFSQTAPVYKYGEIQG